MAKINELSDSELEGISGGAASPSATGEDPLWVEFHNAWNKLGIPAKGYTEHREVEEFDNWSKVPGTAETYLKTIG